MPRFRLRLLGFAIGALNAAAPLSARAEEPVIGADVPVTNAVLHSPGGGLTQSSTIAVAGGANGYLVAWHDERSIDPTSSSLRVVRLDRDGQLVQPDIVLVDPPYQDEPGACAVAFGKTSYLVVFTNFGAHGVYGMRVSEDGNVLDPTPFVIGPTMPLGNPSVAFDGESYQVAWIDDTPSYSGPIHVARVSVDGVASPPELLYLQDAGTPSLACRNGECAVSWYAEPEIAHSHPLHVLPFSPDGTPLGSSIVVGETGGAEYYQIAPALAATPGGYAIAWGDTGSLRAATVTNGTATPFELGKTTDASEEVAIGSDGDRFLVAFSDADQRLFAKAYSVDGAPIGNPKNVDESTPDVGLDRLTLTSARPGEFVLAYSIGPAIHTRLIRWPVSASSSDAGSDAGTDATTPTGDGGVPMGGSSSNSGCGCSTPASSSWSGTAWLLVLMGLGLARVRRPTPTCDG